MSIVISSTSWVPSHETEYQQPQVLLLGFFELLIADLNICSLVAAITTNLLKMAPPSVLGDRRSDPILKQSNPLRWPDWWFVGIHFWVWDSQTPNVDNQQQHLWDILRPWNSRSEQKNRVQGIFNQQTKIKKCQAVYSSHYNFMLKT